MYSIDVELCLFGRTFALRKDDLLPKGKWFGRNWAGDGDDSTSTTWHFRSLTFWYEPLPDDTHRRNGFGLTLGWFHLGIGEGYGFVC